MAELFDILPNEQINDKDSDLDIVSPINKAFYKTIKIIAYKYL
jgi:hypothetical protein